MLNLDAIYAARVSEYLAAVQAHLVKIGELASPDRNLSTEERSVEYAGSFGAAQGLAKCALIDLSVILDHYKVTGAARRSEAL